MVFFFQHFKYFSWTSLFLTRSQPNSYHCFSVCNVLFFSSYFQDFLFIFGFQKSDYDVHRSSFSLYLFILWFAKLLESIDLCITIDFGNFGHSFFRYFFCFISPSSTFGTLISHVLNFLTLFHRSLGICSCFFFMFFGMNNFCCLSFKFTDFFLCHLYSSTKPN